MTVFHIAIVPPKPALTGQRITSGRGSLGVSITKALTGRAITSTRGTVSFSTSGLTLLGQRITSAQGTLGVSKGGSAALTGQAITSHQGTIFASKPLTGFRITSSKGAVGVGISKALQGQAFLVSKGFPVSLNITDTSPITPAQVGVPYTYHFTVVGEGLPPSLQFTLLSATPNTGNWLKVTDSTGGRIGGTPTVLETETLSLQVADLTVGGESFAKTFTLNVAGQGFPLTGAYLISGSVQTSFGTTAFQQSVAKMGVAVIGLFPGWTSGGFTLQSAAAAVKAINPNIRLFPYTNLMELESGVGPSGNPYSPIYNAAVTGRWFSYNPYNVGNPATSNVVDVDGLAQLGLNVTTFTNIVSSQNYLDWRAAWTAANELTSNWDGVYLDNVLQGNNFSGNVDFRQTGTSVVANTTTPKQDFRSGYASYLPKLRTALGAGKLVVGNVADWGNSPITGYVGILDGGVMEHAIGQAFSYEAQSWTALKTYYITVMSSVVAPKYVIFMQDAAATNYAGMRYGLCTCLLDNAYYGNSANGGYGSITLLDEFRFNLGAAIAGPGNVSNGTLSSGGLTVYQNGVWRRDFTNGIILVNPRGNRPNGTVANVTLEVDVWRLRASTYANQDPAVNSAAKITAGTIIPMADAAVAGTGGSGLFLSRTAT